MASACIACGATDDRPLYDVNGFAVVRCRCGLGRTVLPEGFDPATIYTEEYFHGGHKDGYADYLASGEELRYEFRRILAEMPARGAKRRPPYHDPGVSRSDAPSSGSPSDSPGGRLIEIGCAYGFFLEEAASTYTTVGVEISDHARDVCRQRGLDVHPEVTAELLAGKGPFDAAVMLDVLEHMPSPGDTLDLLYAAMRPGGRLVITTGDFGSALARAMGRRWRLMTPPQHLWFFTQATLSTLLARHGFRVESVAHPWKLVPVALALYQASRYVGGQALVRRFMPPGRLPINLFDAMRVTAVRVDGDQPATGYDLACRHARGRVLDLASGLGGGTRLLAKRGLDVVGVTADPTRYVDRDGFDTVVVIEPPSHDKELVVVRALAALRPHGTLVASTDLSKFVERYGLREIDRADGARAWQR